jgi:hypothetical protein
VRQVAFPAGLDSLETLAHDAVGDYARAADDESAAEFEALESATLRRDGNDWRLTFRERVEGQGAATDRVVEGIVGAGDWVTTEAEESGTAGVPVALRGGVLPGGAVRVDVIFIDTPHRLTLTFDRDSRTVEPRWRTRPLRLRTVRTLRAVPPGENFAVDERTT